MWQIRSEVVKTRNLPLRGFFRTKCKEVFPSRIAKRAQIWRGERYSRARKSQIPHKNQLLEMISIGSVFDPNLPFSLHLIRYLFPDFRLELLISKVCHRLLVVTVSHGKEFFPGKSWDVLMLFCRLKYCMITF